MIKHFPRSGVVIASVLVGASVFGASANAKQPECQVVNLPPKQTFYNSNTHANPLGSAIAEANAGDTLRVIGTCAGNFVVDKDLTVTGRSSEEHNDTIEGVDGGGTVLSAPSVHLTVRHLTITGSSGGSGIGSFGTGSSLTVDHALVTGNTGNGIASIYGSTATIDDSVVTNNRGTYGRGVYTYGGMTIRNSTISGNGGDANGAGVFARGTDNFIEGSVIEGNLTSLDGGGIYLIDSGALAITDSTVSRNRARSGGGIFNFSGGATTITNSTVSDNTATSSGSGIYNNGALTLTDSLVTRNVGSGVIGGSNATTVAVANTTISENTGVGIGAYSGSLNIRDSLITRNNGTGVTNSGGAAVTIENSTISENTSASYAGLYNSLATMTIRNSVVRDNTATGTTSGATSYPGNGGGIGTRGDLTIENSRITGNHALLGGRGGAIYRAQLSNLVITDSVITGNEATGGAGGSVYPLSMTGVTLNGSNTLCGNTPDDWAPCSGTPYLAPHNLTFWGPNNSVVGVDVTNYGNVDQPFGWTWTVEVPVLGISNTYMGQQPLASGETRFMFAGTGITTPGGYIVSVHLGDMAGGTTAPISAWMYVTP